ncbi:hypothetical protein L202_04845 [Cryptococcus amylolentus CBS 6039]|uniref:Large ribosomal subunit protein uL29m n=2 Tax=Cryptococcus amylolentus TaxID=104669 RepID=A0A1E3HMX4_9TREE|nr:hypothetical protein L202_04845 [Cryptococcus amylolentus CBS 6039]ODN77700.1 hypothetical protein L202_04845 [Cryptococcus amylolentus CBS 6039]ODO05710.1 hypothetical protein I350_04770 [Cryptococcus amylolentus CBS 6273]
MSRLSLARFTLPLSRPLPRLMHTDGRQVDHSSAPAPHQPPPSPSTVAPLPNPDPAAINTPVTAPSTTPSASAPRLTRRGTPIPTRPARKIPTTLPNGDLEPPFYPPPPEYFVEREERDKALLGKAGPVHPLWKFFHVPVANRLEEGANWPNSAGSLEELKQDDMSLHSGRAWSAAELRQKSFQDLHTLWYILVRERNVLATQNAERKRLGIGHHAEGIFNTKRAFRCRKTMARIKYVLNERRLGLIATAGPHLPDAPRVPWSSSPTTDPAGSTDAIRGVQPLSPRLAAFLRDYPSVGGGNAVAELEGGEESSFVEDGEVAEEEVEARDEGFGGGKEAKEFDAETVVNDGKVEKKE